MASGSHQGYGFGSSDDNNNNNNGGGGGGGTTYFDPSSIAAKEFNKTRMARPSAFPTATYRPPEESSFDEDVISTVEKTMKKYADNLMRFLEGISSRLSQLELYCYNLDKSIGEMRSDLVRDHGDSESKLKSLEKHIQEVQRSVQILRDKQELADTQKELAKLQLVSKESSSSGNTLQNEERSLPPTPEAKQNENPSDMHGQQLALALPNQVAPQPSLPARQMEHQQPHMVPQSSMPTQSMATQVQAYYLPAAPQMTNRPAPSQPSQIQYHPVPAQSQIQDPSMTAPQPVQSQVNQTSHYQSLPPYQQQWSQQVQQPFMQPQIRPSSQPIYSSYPPTQPSPAPNSMPMQVFGASSQPQPPTQNLKTNYEAQTVDGYVPSGPRSSLPHGNAYVIYDGEGGRIHHPPPPPHFQQSAYSPTSMGLQNPQRMPVANMVGPQSMRSHPYNELIEKLASMGYRGDHIVGVIQRLEESGQAVDFNAVLDRLNGHSSGGSQRGWSG